MQNILKNHLRYAMILALSVFPLMGEDVEGVEKDALAEETQAQIEARSEPKKTPV